MPTTDARRGPLKVREVRTHLLQHRLSKPVRSARAPLQTRQALLVEVVTEDGISGWGEAAGPAVVARAAIEQALGPMLVGKDAFALNRHWQTMFNPSRESGRRGVMISALSALDIALWDVVGKALGLPIHALLGGAVRDRLQAYATGFYFTEDADQVAAAAAEAEQYLGWGFRALKIKLGLGPKLDLARIDAVRRMVGDDVLLMTDASRAYDFPTALRLGRELEARDIGWYEEPVAPEDLDGYRRLADALDMPIAGGESEQTKWAFAEIVATRAMDIIQPDPCRAGGITECRKIMALAEAWSIGFVPHVYGSAIKAAAALHLAAVQPDYPASMTPPMALFEVVFEEGRDPMRDELLVEPLRREAGVLYVPQGAGLGVEPSPAALQRFTAD